jgi:hypothetical protein
MCSLVAFSGVCGSWGVTLGGTLSGKRDPRVCLVIGRPPKTPLVDKEP